MEKPNTKPNGKVIAYFQMDKNKKRVLDSKESYESCAKSAFELADDYYKMATSLVRIHPMSLMELAVISTLALSCELFIKAILLNNQIEITRTHKLNALFNMLPSNVKAEIKKNHPCSNIRIEHFELNLKEVKNAFPILRYGYEYSSMACNVVFIAELANTLAQFCNQFFKKATSD